MITKILPEIAKKSSNMLDKPVPSLDKVITKIMDVVWIEDIIEYEKTSAKSVQSTLFDESSEKHEGGWITKSTVMVVNYKDQTQKFNLYAVIPEDAVIGNVTPKPTKITDNYIKWNLDTIPPADKRDIYFELAGLDKEDFDENDLYIENINPSYVIGADKWEGD